MSVATHHDHLTPEQTTRLESLDELRRRRKAGIQERKAHAERTRRRAPPIPVREIRSKSLVPLESLTACDVVLGAAERLASIGMAIDAAAVARPLLGTLLRLAWVRVARRPLANPAPHTIPHKLRCRNVIDLATARRWKHVAGEATTAADMVDVSRELLVWLSDDTNVPTGSKGGER